MRKKYIDYYAIQCDILKKLYDDPKKRCVLADYGDYKVLTDGVYGVIIPPRYLHLKIDDRMNVDFLFKYLRDYDYVLASSIVPVLYKKKRLYKISAGDWHCYVDRRLFDFFGSQVGVYIASNKSLPIFFMDKSLLVKGFLFPIRVCETEVI